MHKKLGVKTIMKKKKRLTNNQLSLKYRFDNEKWDKRVILDEFSRLDKTWFVAWISWVAMLVIILALAVNVMGEELDDTNDKLQTMAKTFCLEKEGKGQSYGYYIDSGEIHITCADKTYNYVEAQNGG